MRRWYEQDSSGSGARGCCPARSRAAATSTKARLRRASSASATRIRRRPISTTPAASGFRTRRSSTGSSFDRIEGEARVLLSLDRGDALMVEKPFGKGRVIAVATTANAPVEQSSAAARLRAADAAARHLPRHAERRAAVTTCRHAAPGQPRAGTSRARRSR